MSPLWLSRDGKMKSWVGAIRVYTIRNAYLMRTETFRLLGGWDEDLFIQFDENDICYRSYLLGKIVACIGDATIVDINNRTRNPLSFVDELGLDRYSLGVRNSVLVALKNASFPVLLFIFPFSVCFTLIRGAIDGNFRRTLRGLSSSFPLFSKFLEKRRQTRLISWKKDIFMLFHLLKEEAV